MEVCGREVGSVKKMWGDPSQEMGRRRCRGSEEEEARKSMAMARRVRREQVGVEQAKRP